MRFVGGKRWLASKLVPEILASKARVYIEPFLGGGAIALSIPTIPIKILSDVNVVVMDVWRCLRAMPVPLNQALRELEDKYGNSEHGYYQARARFNEMIRQNRLMWCERAAHALFINARCFNGLWRTNSKGFFNVPWGDLTNPRQLSLEEIESYSTYLRSGQTTLCDGDFHLTLARWREQDARHIAVYADPPYDSMFDDYDGSGFSRDEQLSLAEELKFFASTGAQVWATNNDTPFIREIYKWAHIEEIDERHAVSAKASSRGKKKCLLIRGRKP